MDTPTTISLRREPGALVRSLIALLLRVGLGMMLLLLGLGKFEAKRRGEYPAMILREFQSARLPGTTGALPGLETFTRVLPYAEVSLGCALIVGLLTPLSAILTGILLLHLLFGNLVLNDLSALPGMQLYLMVTAAILWLSPVTSNYLSIDGLIFGWFWRPRAEGEYHREITPQGIRY